MKHALISVSDKTSIVPLAQRLVDYGIQIIASDGTAAVLQASGIETMTTSQYLMSEPILNGRVKTLHPKLFAGILAIQNNPAHQQELQTHKIQAIDFVIVDLYPFERYKHHETEAIENIDIGGVSLIRAAAKNYASCTVICCKSNYPSLMDELETYQGDTSLDFRQNMAATAFRQVSAYDQQIATWMMEKQAPVTPPLVLKESIPLSYGENPYQKAGFYLPEGEDPIIQPLQGKPLSYNNLLDLDAGIKLVAELPNKAAAVFKHTNPCGVAMGDTAKEAVVKAFNADLKSAFGGIVVLNTVIDEPTAQYLITHFIEVIAAPDFTDAARLILSKKEKMRVIQFAVSIPPKEYKSALNGVLIQETNVKQVILKDCNTPTRLQPDADRWDALLFAATIVKHMKSNAIAIINGDATIGLSSGQTNRVDAIEAAIQRAQASDLSGAVLASDGFFPFTDNIERIAQAGIQCIIQPGGSIRDEEIINYCDESGICMVMTNSRQFKH